MAGLATWIALETSKAPNQLVSGAGYIVFIFLLFLISKYPDKVNFNRKTLQFFKIYFDINFLYKHIYFECTCLPFFGQEGKSALFQFWLNYSKKI